MPQIRRQSKSLRRRRRPVAAGSPHCSKNSFPPLSIRASAVRRTHESAHKPMRPTAQTIPQRTEYDMKVMVIVKADAESEAGVMPSQQLLEQMGSYNEELVNAGIMLAGEGLHPTSRGARVRFDGRQRTVIDGPFTESKELICGFWLWQVRSLDEAIEWLKRAPFDGGAEIEIRPIFEMEDFGDAMTPALREQEERMRQQTEQRN